MTPVILMERYRFLFEHWKNRLEIAKEELALAEDEVRKWGNKLHVEEKSQREGVK